MDMQTVAPSASSMTGHRPARQQPTRPDLRGSPAWFDNPDGHGADARAR